MKQIAVIIPVRKGGNPRVTLESLARQTFQDFDVIVSWDQKGNANWARNRGAALSKSPLLLFSDDDIVWEPDALAVLCNTLQAHPQAAYAYGSYDMPGKGVQCNIPFNVERLRQTSYISTMSLVHRKYFLGFDEEVQRLQDWDLWLSLAEHGWHGVYAGRLVFRTRMRPGITYGTGVTWEEAREIVMRKHKLL